MKEDSIYVLLPLLGITHYQIALLCDKQQAQVSQYRHVKKAPYWLNAALEKVVELAVDDLDHTEFNSKEQRRFADALCNYAEYILEKHRHRFQTIKPKSMQSMRSKWNRLNRERNKGVY
jgi:hypothetical protein